MGEINKIQLPDNTVYDVIDASKSGIYTVKGTQTATTASWTGNINIDALYDGLTIAYYLPRTSKTNVTLTLTLKDGTKTAAIPVYVTGETRMTTHYAAGSTIYLTYWSAGSISVNGTATTAARWTSSDYYISKSDTKVRQTLATNDTNRPLLMSHSDNTDSTSSVDNVSYRNNSIYANPSTGTITATKFVGDISGCTGGTYASPVDIVASEAEYAEHASYADEALAVSWEYVGQTPTTLAGYGITDAKIASGVITLGTNTITPLTSSSTLNAAKLTGTVPASCYTDTNTWRPIKFEGGGIITDNSTPLDFYQGDNISFTFGMGTDDGKMWISATDTKVSQIINNDSSDTHRYPLLFSQTNSSDTSEVTNAVYRNNSICAYPSNGSLWANSMIANDGTTAIMGMLSSSMIGIMGPGVPIIAMNADASTATTDISAYDTWDGTNTSLKTALSAKASTSDLSGKLDKAGDTMTGGLLINYQHPELQFKTTDWTINTTSNNGLSEDAGTGTVQMYGNDNTMIGRFNVYGNSAGATRARMQCYNKTTSGDTVTAGFGVQANKNGTVEYYVESPETLRRTCNGAYGWRQWTTAGTTYTVSSNALAEFHYGIMMGGTTTASLFVIGGSPGSYSLTLTKLTSTDLTTNFTVTLNATSGKLTVKNKSSSNISFCILGY